MKVAIFFGSGSDADTMKKAAEILRQFGVDFVAFVLSAHRSVSLLAEKLQAVEKDGCEVIIAGAGLAAHLPGAIASLTVLPVIGIPLECITTDKKGRSSNGLGGMDALLSIVQMPRQIPVATVGINNAENASYLALEILAVKYPKLRTKLLEFRKKLVDEAAAAEGELL